MTSPAETQPESSAASAGELLELITELAHEVHPALDRDRVSMSSVLDRDLGLDSLSRVELLLRIEQRFDSRIREEELAVAETPADVLALIRQGGARSEWKVEQGADKIRLASEEQSVPTSAETLIEVLEWHAERRPEQTHLLLYGPDEETETLTYGELYAGAVEVGAGLWSLGASPGDCLAIMLPTSLEYFQVFYGALVAGLIPVPLYPPVRPSQLEDHLLRQVRILDNCQAKMLVTVPEARAPARILKAQVDSLTTIATVPEVRHEGSHAGPPSFRGRAQDLAFLQYTSGSTGQPKGVSLTHDNLLANLRVMLKAAEVGPGDVFVSWLPLYHDMGLIGVGMGSLYHALPLVLMSPLAFLSRPSRWLRAISDHGGTVSAGPNFAYELCLSKIPERELEGVDLSSWRLALNGAEPVLPDTLRRFVDRFTEYGLRRECLFPVYGLAEHSLGAAFPPVGRAMRVDRIQRARFVSDQLAVESEASREDAPRTRESDPRNRESAPKTRESDLEFVGCGYPLPGHQMRIADPFGHELPERSIGRIQLKGPSVTRGYYRNPEATRALWVGDWMDSGDLGYVVGGELFVTGRAKDLIIKAGRNLAPHEIEEAVGQVPGVRKGCVAAFGTNAESANANSRGDGGTGTESLIVLAETRLEGAAERESLRERIVAATTDAIGVAADQVVLAPPGTVLKTSSGKIRRAACKELYESGDLGRKRPGVAVQLARLGLVSLLPQARAGVRRALSILHTLYVWVGIVAVVGSLFVLASMVPGAVRRQRLALHAARLLLWFAGVRLRVTGLANLPHREPFVLAANHASYVDSVILTAVLFPGVRFVAKREIAPLSPIRWLLGRIGIELVERFNREQSVEDAGRLLTLLQSGQSLAVFPEGTFTRIAGLLPFRLGAFENAAKSGVPVVPAVLRGTRSILRANDWILRRGPVSLSIQEPLRPNGSDWASVLDLRDRTREVLLRYCGEPDLIGEREEGLEKVRAARTSR